MYDPDLRAVREWANAKLATGKEPPWAWYQYMKLRETLDAILAGQQSTTPQGLPESVQHPGTHLQVVENTDQQDTAQRHPADEPVLLPM